MVSYTDATFPSIHVVNCPGCSKTLVVTFQCFHLLTNPQRSPQIRRLDTITPPTAPIVYKQIVLQLLTGLPLLLSTNIYIYIYRVSLHTKLHTKVNQRQLMWMVHYEWYVDILLLSNLSIITLHTTQQGLTIGVVNGCGSKQWKEMFDFHFGEQL